MWGETVRRVRPERKRELRTGQWDETAWNSKGGALNESRSAVITDYRRTSTAAQRATEAARASLTAYSDSESNHRRIGEIQQRTGEALQSIERASNELINIIKQLQNPKLSADLLKNLENSLKQRLESHLKQLVTDLNIENQAETIIENILPNLVQAVIEIKLKPLTERVIEKMSSVEQYQQNLAGLIQQVSSRL